jgi:hypothetical protein
VLRLSSVSRRARRMSLSLLAALGLAGVAVACADSSTGNVTSGKISVLLTDAPGDIKTAVVTISQIYLQGGEGDDASGRVILRDTPVTTDLLTLANSTAELVKDATIPAGTYAQLRFVITGGYIEVENADGTTSIFATSPTYAGLPSGAVVAGALQTPSFASSGLKVVLPNGGVTIDATPTALLVDFDVSQSYGKEVGSGKWVMSPVIKAEDLGETGSLRVTLAKADGLTLPSVGGTPVTLGQFKAVLTDAASAKQEIALTDANSDGVFEATYGYLAAGSYTLDFVAPAGVATFTTTPTRPTPVSITAGASATHAATVTAAAP